MMDIRNRLGEFSISVDLIESRPDAVLAVMSEVIITRAECQYITRDHQHIVYRGMCSQFEKLEPGVKIPTYQAVIDAAALDAGYKDVVKFQRM